MQETCRDAAKDTDGEEQILHVRLVTGHVMVDG